MLHRLVLPSPKKNLKKFQIRIQSETHALLLRASFFSGRLHITY